MENYNETMTNAPSVFISSGTIMVTAHTLAHIVGNRRWISLLSNTDINFITSVRIRSQWEFTWFLDELLVIYSILNIWANVIFLLGREVSWQYSSRTVSFPTAFWQKYVFRIIGQLPFGIRSFCLKKEKKFISLSATWILLILWNKECCGKNQESMLNYSTPNDGWLRPLKPGHEVAAAHDTRYIRPHQSRKESHP